MHPDIFFSGHSGAIAARQAARLLTGLGHQVGVFTYDEENRDVAKYPYYRRIAYTGMANYRPGKYRESFDTVIRDFRPDYMFFIGGIINTPVVYLDLCRLHGIRTAFMLLVQDFYCARLHAALGTGSCTRCLDGSNLNAFLNHCGEKQRKPSLYLLNYQLVQHLFLSRLRKVDMAYGSTDEQLGFYRRVGIPKENMARLPLFFDQNRVRVIPVPTQNYFVIIGQYRHEKGIHLISKILDYIRDGITVKLLLYNKEEEKRFLEDFPDNLKHIQSGKLEVLPGVTMTMGALEIIAAAKGVINPTVWATTTEFVFQEALGMAKPVVAFDVGIHRETIRNRVNGICVKTGDFRAMGEEIARLCDDPELETRISEGALKLYHELTDDTSFTGILQEFFI